MKTPIVVLATFIAASALAAVAADPPKKELTPQQQRMSDCAHESKGMKGDAHKQFMSDCLKGKTAPGAGAGAGAGAATPKMTAQQERMKECNAEAGKGKMAPAERKKFMSDCLKGDHPAVAAATKAPAAPAKAAADGKTDPKVRMKECNTEAGGKKLKGDERKKFMSECLKG